jgi:hypothetical protein
MIAGIIDERARLPPERRARYLPTPTCPEAFAGDLTKQRQLGAQGQAAHPHATKMRLKPLPKRLGPDGLDPYWHLQLLY